MEKIKSRWRKNYLEGDIIKDDNSDSGGYNNSKSNENTYNSNHNNIDDSLDGLHHNININNSNNSSSNHHRHHHHHNHHPNSNNNNSNNDSNDNSNNNSSSKRKHSTPPTFEPITENLHLDKRKNEHSRSRKDARSMVCDCILTKEERARGIMGCLDDCLNRMLMIECGPKCTLGDHCLNKRFQKSQSAKVEVFKTRKKGWGLRAITDLPANSFIMEYVGEVVRSKEFRSRVKRYTKQKIKHHYFMALKSDEIIDATCKGNQTRFINHSCEPNCETQKWTVDGDLRIGFFTIRNLQAGEEITFDYQFQRYGRKAQKCYCEAPSCRGFIGGNEQTFSLNGGSSPQLNENKAHKRSYKHGLLLDVTLEDKINALTEAASQGLKTKDQVIALASLSIKVEEVSDRRKLLDIIKATKSEISLRLFVDYHGLEILCLWMRDPQADCDFKATIIDILGKLPIPNKTKVMESNVYRMIERWATEEIKTVQSQSQENQFSNENNDSEDVNSSYRQQNPLPDQNINSPNIKALASKLLKKFQALSPGFKIPRLSRLQRMEIEKKMEEEVISDDSGTLNNKSALEQKNPFSRSFFKAGATTNGLVKDVTLKTNVLPHKRRFDSLTKNNIDLTPAPKISKEEHRQQFEMRVRLEDYFDTIEKHYGPAAAKQIKLSHQRALTSINGLPLPYPHPASQNLGFLGASNYSLTAPTIPPSLLVAQQAQQSQPSPALATTATTSNSNSKPHLMYPTIANIEAESRFQQPPLVVPTNVSNYHLASHLQSNGQQQQQELAMAYRLDNRDYSEDTAYHEFYASHLKELEHENIVSTASDDIKMEITKPEPTNLPTLIVLANNSIEPAHAIDDKLAFSICDYDEYYSIRDKQLSVDDIIDNLYPYPGSYYTTPNGETWFAAVTLDRKTQQPRTVILTNH